MEKTEAQNVKLKIRNRKLKYELEKLKEIEEEHKRINGELREENEQLKDNWNKLKEYLINDLNNRNGHIVAEYEDGNKVSETISPIYTLIEDKSKTMKEVLYKMKKLEQGSDNDE